MRMRGAHKDGKGDAIFLDIVKLPAVPGDQRLVLDATERLMVRFGIHAATLQRLPAIAATADSASLDSGISIGSLRSAERSAAV